MRTLALITLCTAAGAAMAIDIAPLWDFARPDVSEQRFRTALEMATGDDALILRTQIARSYGLRREFERARQLLREVEAVLGGASAEVRVRYNLELGRTFASATHPKDSVTDDAKAHARQAYGRALELARAAKLDALAIDAIHMFAFVDTTASDQLKWGEAALGVVLSSEQADAKRWEASVRNNIGYALHQLGRYDEALSQFQQALVLRERGTSVDATRVARWMVAWTLRSLKRTDEAIRIQHALEQDADVAGNPDPHVFEELEALYREKGDLGKAQHYAERTAAAKRK